jgi:3-hydroxybutyryl-CoA dehydrogenase
MPLPFTSESRIGVVGAGAMGSGIALVAAAAGHPVTVTDTSDVSLGNARRTIDATLARDVEKGRRTSEQAATIVGRVSFIAPTDGRIVVEAFHDAALVIEAVIERLDVKQELFARLESVVAAECVLASNTSSLSIASIGAKCKNAERVIGVHFFNPAPLMPLVEIVPSLTTSPDVLRETQALVDAWGKMTVVAADTPGFIVNRIARPYYGEAIRIYDEGIADPATIDWAMKELGGFKMGPFEVMDFVGHDVNYAVTTSVFEAFYFDPRFKPSITQKRLVEAGFLGRKAGRGFYDYRPGVAKPAPVQDRALGRRIFDRILAMLINEAADAVFMRVASVTDIERAMTNGVNYPRGLLAWADEIGIGVVANRLTALQAEYGEDRYRSCPLLRRMAREGRRFHA